jgi:hypothetical protein
MPASATDEYFDTNVAIESHRVGAWKAIASAIGLITVEKVIEECGAGAGRREGYVEIDVAAMRTAVEVLKVTGQELTTLRLKLAGRVNLDAGEENLLAKSISGKGSWKICSPDNALIRACALLGHLENVISLEELLERIGFRCKIPLQRQYTKTWLSMKKTDLLLELEIPT